MPPHTFSKCLLSFSAIYLFTFPAQAQIVPDSSLGKEQSTVLPSQIINGIPSNMITGGAVRGVNLFHSFDDFNVQAGRGAYFTNPVGVNNILTRITGHNPSNLLGTLGVLGQANLFFLNPNGIFFGSSSKLNLNGSFIGTTATSIDFSDGTHFSARDSQPVPLLSINVPIGLSFAGTPTSIEVKGEGFGYFLKSYFPRLVPTPIPGAGSGPVGLKVRPGNTLALIGGNVNFDGAIVTSSSGKLEIAAVGAGQVRINNIPAHWSFDYSNVLNLKNIYLNNLTLLDASGIDSSQIHLQGNQITILNGSFALIQNSGTQSNGDITVDATEALTISGKTSNSISGISALQYLAGLNVRSLSGGRNNIFITTKTLTVQSGGNIGNNSLYFGSGGDISINASDIIQVLGYSPLFPLYGLSVISNTSTGSANAGKVLLNTKRLFVNDGAGIDSATYGTGSGGALIANASESVLLQGVNPSSFAPSDLVASTFASGNAGNLLVNTPRLTLLNGGRVDSSSDASGLAGSVTINAPDFIKISGTVPRSINPSLISSSASPLDPELQQILELPSSVASGSSGDVIINTNNLSITNGALLSVSNQGPRAAGTLIVNARSIFLDNQGGITASTASGAGGNILLNVSNQLSLDHKSLITATAGGQGKGGNINIDPQQTLISNGSGIAVNSTGTGNAGQLKISSNSLTLNNGGFLSANTNSGEGGNISVNARDLRLQRGSAIDASALGGTKRGGNIALNTGTLVMLDSSRVKADAYGGPGGNIAINAQGIFRSPDSAFSASSRFGVSGTVRINTLDVSRNLELAALPAIPVDYTKLIPPGCSASVGPRASKFVVTGSGGLPPSPSDFLGGKTALEDWGTGASSASTLPTSDRADRADIENAIPSTQYEYHGGPLIEAQGWITNSKGEVVLVANAPTYTPDVPWLKSPSCHAQ